MTKHFESETCHGDEPEREVTEEEAKLHRASGIQKFLNSCPLHCEPHGAFGVNWSKPGMGFGQAHFYFSAHEEGGELKLYCDNERMSKDFIKEMLCQMVDEAQFEDEGK